MWHKREGKGQKRPFGILRTKLEENLKLDNEENR
jgi:hypothetical protein